MIPNYQMQSNYYPQQQYSYAQQIPSANFSAIKTGINGKFVNNFSEITANDVPMDGTIACFPKNDLSEIECRQWNSNGTISKIAYKPVTDTNISNITNCMVDDEKVLEKALNDLTNVFNERLDKLEKLIKPTRTTAKKESEAE